MAGWGQAEVRERLCQPGNDKNRTSDKLITTCSLINSINYTILVRYATQFNNE